MINIRRTVLEFNFTKRACRRMSLMVMKFIGINYIPAMISEEMRNAVSFGFGLMPTARNGANKEFTLLLIGSRMCIKNMIAKIGFTLVFLGAMGAEERSFMSFHVVVHGALKPFRFVADRTDEMTSFIFDIFIHCGGSYSPQEKSAIQFYSRGCHNFWNIKDEE